MKVVKDLAAFAQILSVLPSNSTSDWHEKARSCSGDSLIFSYWEKDVKEREGAGEKGEETTRHPSLFHLDNTVLALYLTFES